MTDPNLSDFVQLTDMEAGERLGWQVKTRKATSRGQAAKRVVTELLALPAGQKLPLHHVSSAAHKETLDRLFELYPYLLPHTEGYLPRASAMMAIVAYRMKGPITSASLSVANDICSQVVSEVLGPRLRRFIKETLHPEGPFVPPNESQLIDFLTGPYAQYAKAEANSLVSRAGSLNEALVREAINAAGLPDAIQTGTEGNADIQIIAKTLSPPQTLNVEVKSYGARERLVRGLHDCNAPKVGVGFFNKSSEFNADRTTQLLGTNASAIYLPERTFSDLDPKTRARQNSNGGQFYRPLAQFGPDMKRFSEVGTKAFSPT